MITPNNSHALNLFPLSHELGHLHLRHVDAPDKQLAVERLGDFPLYAHDDEYQTDTARSSCSAGRRAISAVYGAVAGKYKPVDNPRAVLSNF